MNCIKWLLLLTLVICSCEDTANKKYLSGEIFSINVDGTGEYQITQNQRYYVSADYILNDEKILAWSGRYLYFINPNNGEADPLVDARNFDLSEDGQSLIFISKMEDPYITSEDISWNNYLGFDRVYLLDLENPIHSEIVWDDSTRINQFSASPNHSKFVVYSYEKDDEGRSIYQVVLHRLQENDKTILFEFGDENNYWNIYGLHFISENLIAVIISNEEGNFLYHYRISTSEFNEVLSLHSFRGLDFSPNQNEIVYSTQVGLYNELILLQLETGEKTRLTYSEEGGNQYPKFSPDGSKIVFENYRDFQYTSDVMIMNRTGSEMINITNGKRELSSKPVFSKDGEKILFIGEGHND